MLDVQEESRDLVGVARPKDTSHSKIIVGISDAQIHVALVF
jgi:hypothetical protein